MVEAQARGLPVLGAKSGAIPELIMDNETGFVFNPDSPEQLAGLLEKLYNDKELWKNFSDKAIEWSRKAFSTEASRKKLYELYEDFAAEYVCKD